MDTNAFVEWFRANSEALRARDPEVAGQEVMVELQKLDERLVAEVSDEVGGPRELVFSAQGDSELFELLEDLAPRLATEGWTIHPLRPPRGFEFKLDADGTVLDARTLYFEPLESPSMPGILGLRLFVDEPAVPALSELAWWVLETGIGEKACALIEHLEVAALPEDTGDLMPIRALANFIDWHTHRRQSVARS
ncbi:MAG: hypothetical protein IRZ16_16915 [Myxococcaceae bacterium]|nr:hypothetical protein [Myxococcaceae bacterium]